MSGKVKGILSTAFAAAAFCAGGLALPAATAPHDGYKAQGNTVPHTNKTTNTKTPPKIQTQAQNTSPPPPKQSTVTFDYAKNHGQAIIGTGARRMGIDFSGGDESSIYIYNEGAFDISVANAGNTPPGKTLNIANYNTGSYVQTINIGQTFLVKNLFNYCAQGRVDAIQAKGYNSNRDLVTFNYQITKCPAVQLAGGEPDTLQVFGATAMNVPPSADLNAGQWNAIPSLQKHYMHNRADAAGYRSFLAQFNRFRGESLTRMADNVNAIDHSEITYTTYTDCTDTAETYADCRDGRYFWPSPIQTEMRREGNCIDQAILQYYIMRYLGVPVNRLFIADVDAEGLGYADHDALLLNTAPAGQKPDFLVLNDHITPVLNARDYEHYSTLPQGWSNPYTFYAARNQAGFWETKRYAGYSTPGVQASPAVKPALKVG